MAKKDGPIGFSSLIDLASNLDDLNASVTSAPTATIVEPTGPSRQTSEAKSSEIGTTVGLRMSPAQEPGGEGNETTESTGGTLNVTLLLVGLLVFLLLFLALERAFDSSTSNPGTGQILVRDMVETPRSGMVNPAPVDNVSATAEVTYEMPPVGTDVDLSVPQICWCIRESIRIESTREIFQSPEGIVQFNNLVDEYNRRCASYRYRVEFLERATRLVDAHRHEIVADAAMAASALEASFHLPELEAAPRTQAAQTAPTDLGLEETKEVQFLLTELGYKPGPIDGHLGARTVAALRAFQSDTGLPGNGLIDNNLILWLRSAVSVQRNTPAIGQADPANRKTRAFEVVFLSGMTVRADKITEQSNSYLLEFDGGFFLIDKKSVKSIVSLADAFPGNYQRPGKNDIPLTAQTAFPPSIPLPENGMVVRLTKAEAEAPLEIVTPSGQGHYYVKLVDIVTKNVVMTVFIRSGQKVDVKVPLGEFEMRYATGETWYGDKLLFGEQTTYSRADATLRFRMVGDHVEGYTIQLYMQENGNLDTESMRAEDF